MPFSFPKFPKSITTCGAAICAGVVLLLQNADSCAHWLQEQLASMALYSSAQDVPRMLQRLGSMAGLEWLDGEERAFADDVAREFEMTLARGEEDRDGEPVEAVATISESEQDDLENLQNETPARLTVAAELRSTPVCSTTEKHVPPTSVKLEVSRLVPKMPARTSRSKRWIEPKGEKETRALVISAPPGTLSMKDVLECALGEQSDARTDSTQGEARVSNQALEIAEVRHEDTHQQEMPLHKSHRMSQITAAEGGEAGENRQGKKAPPRLTKETPSERVHQETPEEEKNAPPVVRDPAPSIPRPDMLPPMRYRIQMVGDSMMEGLGPMMHSSMREYKGVEFYINAKVSTGLCRQDFFNWPMQLRETLRRHKSDMVIFFFGANDGQSIVTEEGVVPIGGQRWRDAYAAKMAEMVEMVRNAGADVIWIQMPALGEQRYQYMHETQIAQREFCEKHGISSLRTDDAFSGEWGRFEAFGDFHGKYVRLRTKDTAHFTREGYLKLTEHLLPIVKEHMARFYAAHPECRLSTEEVARIRKVPAVVVASYVPYKAKRRKRGEKKGAGL